MIKELNGFLNTFLLCVITLNQLNTKFLVDFSLVVRILLARLTLPCLRMKIRFGSLVISKKFKKFLFLLLL